LISHTVIYCYFCLKNNANGGIYVHYFQARLNLKTIASGLYLGLNSIVPDVKWISVASQ